MFTKKLLIYLTCPLVQVRQSGGGKLFKDRRAEVSPHLWPLSNFLSFFPFLFFFWKCLSHLHYSFRSALPGSCGLQMVRIGKELQDWLLQLVTAAIFRDYLCIVRQWGDSVTPARRRMLFAKESVLEPIKFLTTCYSLPGNEMWGKNWMAPSFEEPRQFTVKILRGNITFIQYLIAVFWGQDHFISNLLISDTVVIISSSLSRGTWYLQNDQE